MNKIKAIIFDMDGVISDTLFHHTQSESKVLKKFGIHMTPKEIGEKFNAVPDDIMFKQLFKKHNKHFDYHDVADKKLSIFKNLVKERLSPIPGSLELISRLHREEYFLGVASSAPAEIIELILTTLNVKNNFPAITATEEVQNGKPKPDIFLLTAKKLNIEPEECLVIEDAPRGVRAAKAAKMKCIAITTTHTQNELKNADMVIDSFEELTSDIIQSL